jgi:hypothetical protein
MRAGFWPTRPREDAVAEVLLEIPGPFIRVQAAQVGPGGSHPPVRHRHEEIAWSEARTIAKLMPPDLELGRLEVPALDERRRNIQPAPAVHRRRLRSGSA